MKKRKMIVVAAFIALLCGCKNQNQAPESLQKETTQQDQKPMKIGSIGYSVELKNGGSYSITIMTLGDGFLKLSGNFDVDREAEAFAAYLGFFDDEYTLTFELSTKLEKDWSKNLHGKMEFAFALPNNFVDYFYNKEVVGGYHAVYTDFGLGPSKYWIEGKCPISERAFFEPLATKYFIGDLKDVYKIHKDSSNAS